MRPASAAEITEVGGDLNLEADVVVVGSGASGAVVATELATAGQDVIVLEEGKYVPPQIHGRMRPSESLRHLWRDGALTATLGFGSPAVNLSMGKCVGGSSVLTGGVAFRTPEHVLHEWVKDHGLEDLSPERMTPYFDAVERAVHVEEVPEAMRSESTRLFNRGLEKRGISLSPNHRNTDECVGWGRCNFGCPEQSKMSVDISYLPRGMKAGARVYSRCLVERVDISGDQAVGVRGRIFNGPRGQARGRLRVRAKRVVLSAGAVHTPLILMRSGIGKRSRQLGRNMTLHPAFRVFARFEQEVEGWRGSMQSAFSDAYMDQGITLMSVFVPAGVFGAAMPGVGKNHHERVATLPHLAMFGGLIHDHPRGRVWPSLGREPILTYHMHPEDRATFSKAIRLLAEIYFDAGAQEVYLPVLGHEPVDADGLRRIDLDKVPPHLIEASSQHPMGTCRMGTSKDNSVVDPYGETWGVKELFVADAGVLPTSLGVNPQITVMSMATRIAWYLRERALPS